MPVSTQTQVAFLDGVFAGYRHRNQFRTVVSEDANIEMKLKTALIEPKDGKKKYLRFSGLRRNHRR